MTEVPPPPPKAAAPVMDKARTAAAGAKASGPRRSKTAARRPNATRTPSHSPLGEEKTSDLAALGLDAPELYLNRELTWLNFNWRVLHEAQDPRTPLLERVKFLSIVCSNLD